MFEGEPFLEKYTDPEGNPRSALKLNASRLVLLEGKKSEGESQPARAAKPSPKKVAASSGAPFDDEIPF
jgi:hypothetical protein